MKHSRHVRLPMSARNGYAMLLVLVSMLLLHSIIAVAFRHTSAAVRTETARTLRAERDEGSLVALGRGLALLETGDPPAHPYVCAVTVITSSG